MNIVLISLALGIFLTSLSYLLSKKYGGWVFCYCIFFAWLIAISGIILKLLLI